MSWSWANRPDLGALVRPEFGAGVNQANRLHSCGRSADAFRTAVLCAYTENDPASPIPYLLRWSWRAEYREIVLSRFPLSLTARLDGHQSKAKPGSIAGTQSLTMKASIGPLLRLQTPTRR